MVRGTTVTKQRPVYYYESVAYDIQLEKHEDSTNGTSINYM